MFAKINLTKLNLTKISIIVAVTATVASFGSASTVQARPFGFAPQPAFRAAPMARPAFNPSPVRSYPNRGIGQANCWNAGCRQPYQQYPNKGIGAANCWNAGCNQPYNQYHDALKN